MSAETTRLPCDPREVAGCALAFTLTGAFIILGTTVIISFPETFIGVQHFVESTAEQLAKLVINGDVVGLIIIAIPVFIGAHLFHSPASPSLQKNTHSSR